MTRTLTIAIAFGLLGSVVGAQQAQVQIQNGRVETRNATSLDREAPRTSRSGGLAAAAPTAAAARGSPNLAALARNWLTAGRAGAQRPTG